MTSLNTMKLAALGEDLSKLIHEEKINAIEMKILLEEQSFKKLDEDLFYRLKKDSDEKFVPSENQIKVSFHNVVFTICVGEPFELSNEKEEGEL